LWTVSQPIERFAPAVVVVSVICPPSVDAVVERPSSEHLSTVRRPPCAGSLRLPHIQPRHQLDAAVALLDERPLAGAYGGG